MVILLLPAVSVFYDQYSQSNQVNKSRRVSVTFKLSACTILLFHWNKASLNANDFF